MQSKKLHGIHHISWKAGAGRRPAENRRPVPALRIAPTLLTASVRHKEPPLHPSQHFPSTPSRYISSIMMMAMTDCILPLLLFPQHVWPPQKERGRNKRKRDVAASSPVSYKHPRCQSPGRYQTSLWQTRHENNLYLQEVN